MEHRIAGNRALASGRPTQVTNLLMDDYSGSRLARVHGAVAHPVLGAHGLIAECCFAKEIKKSFFLPVARRARMWRFRDYVDDITLHIEAATTGEAVAALHDDLEEVKRARSGESMPLNDAKLPIYGATQARRMAWEALGDKAVEGARDSGAPQGARTHPT